MRGQVTTFAEGADGGTITGDNGEIYRFSASSIRSPSALVAGQRVDFVPLEGIATEVFALDGPSAARTAVSAYGHFDLGRVVERTFKAVTQNWATFLVAAVFLVGIPTVLQVYGQSFTLQGQMTTGAAIMGLGWLLWIVGAYVLQGMVVKITVTGFNGKTMSVGEALQAAVRLFLPLLGLGILIGVGTGLGFILLIVPGIILAVMWSVSTAVLVVEGQGITDSMQRSRELTKGHRWPIFGLFVILFIASMVIGMVFGGIGAATGGGLITNSTSMGIIMVTTTLSNMLTSVIGAAGVAALYYELRSVKEGVGPEELASVFD